MPKPILFLYTALALSAATLVHAQTTEATIGPDRATSIEPGRENLDQAFTKAAGEFISVANRVEERKQATARCLADSATASQVANISHGELACQVIASSGLVDDYSQAASLFDGLAADLVAARQAVIDQIARAEAEAAGRAEALQQLDQQRERLIQTAERRRDAAHDDGELTFEEREEAQELNAALRELLQERRNVVTLAESDANRIANLEIRKADYETAALNFQAQADDLQALSRDHGYFVEQATAQQGALEGLPDTGPLRDAVTTLAGAIATFADHEGPDRSVLDQDAPAPAAGQGISEALGLTSDADPYAFLDALGATQ